MKLKRYWTLKESLYQHSETIDYHQEYTNLFNSAVALRYRSDVPVALLLSGGLDSSAIARVTDNLIEKGALEQNEIHAYIASFPNYKYDETQQARALVKTCKHIKLHEMVIDAKHVVDEFEKTIYSLDHPLGSFASVAHNNIMKECKNQGIKVVLNGQGSDEAFAGYDRYISGAYLLDQLISKKGQFIKEFGHLHRKNGYSVLFLISQMAKSILNQPYASYLRAKYQEKSLACFNKDFIASNRNHYKSQYRFSINGNNFNEYLLNQINHQGLNTILHYEDISSMQQSIEIRSPFLDYRLMEFAFSIPNKLKFQHGVTKVIQRETFGKQLPSSITLNRQKIGFSTPFNEYLGSDRNWRSLINDILQSTSFKSRRIWKASNISTKFKNPSKHPNFPFWRILNLEIWAQVYNVSNL